VTTIVLKLFQILPGSHAFFGQKDYQQLKVIEAMVRDLDVPVQVIGCPIVREADGLAMSSRNRYLNDQDRQRSLLLFRALSRAQDSLHQGETDVQQLQAEMRKVLTAVGEPFPGVDKIDYASIVNPGSLSQIDSIDQTAVALIAAYVGSTRLIDNLVLNARSR
jgi:pantoate--beta-alanine ligase